MTKLQPYRGMITVLLLINVSLLHPATSIARHCLPVITQSEPVGSQAQRNLPEKSSAQGLVDQAQDYIRNKQYEQAIELLQRAVESEPKLAAAHIHLGTALLNAGRIGEALASMKHAVQLQPNDARAYLGLGYVHSAMRRFDDAIEAYKQAVHLDVDYFAAYNNLGIAYGTTNRYEESLQAFQQALRIDSNSADALNGLGIAQVRLGRHAEGIGSVKKAVQLRPNFVNAYLNLARWYQDLDRYEESVDAFTQVTRVVPKFPTSYFERSLNYMYLGKGEAAAADARMHLELTDWHNDRAQFMVIFAVLGYRQAGRDKSAQEVLDLAQQRANTVVWPYPIIKYLRGEITAADLLMYANNNDRMSEAKTYIGMDLLQKDQREEALTHFEWVKKQGNRRFVEYKLALAEIDRLKRSGGAAQ